ncbi:hypothetical protein [Tateyamaria sp. Alg231-49]|uniref:hypothetical protein n=1 Tax=Tateyamaria sp. Alg231-49 TaxID=1922219 RepID=UPI00131ED7F9|nr:hypothetical protein [Tateyamaria sp. Alg231-49]
MGSPDRDPPTSTVTEVVVRADALIVGDVITHATFHDAWYLGEVESVSIRAKTGTEINFVFVQIKGVQMLDFALSELLTVVR